MRFTLIAALAALTTSVAAAPSQSSHVLHERRNSPLRNWVKRDKLERDYVLPMRIGLTQRNLEKGHDLLMEVSQHDSPKYGQHYTAEEVIELFAPAQESVDAVRDWLVSAGIEAKRISQSANKQWIQFDADTDEAERLLKTKYYNYEHTPSGKSHVACEEYHVPAKIQEHVDYITPGIKLLYSSKSRRQSLERRGFKTKGNSAFSPPLLGQPIDENSLSDAATGCGTTVTPACIATFYNITQATKAASTNKLGIFEEGDYFSLTDLKKFFTTFATNIPSATRPTVDGIDGGVAPSGAPGAESDLDLQISYPIIYPQNSIIFQTDDANYASGREGGGGFLNTFLDGIDGSYCTFSDFGETGDASIDPKYPDPLGGFTGQRQCGVFKPTNVISISYGEQEDDLPTNYQQRQCAEFMKLGMQGTSVFIASGDSGVAARGTDDGNADGCLGTTGKVFNPDFPASCPFVSAVGATVLPANGNAAADAETAVTRFPSGGGFSNIYATPSYQSSLVNTYLTSHVPTTYKSYSTSGTNNPSAATTNGGIYNRGGRGYPDFSAIGDNVAIVFNGQSTTIGGTSASSPVFAAIINRVNEERIAVGKAPVGFVNPTLYAHPEVFHDITVGSNPGCGTQGFPVSAGWDPVTGLGTPNYPKILALFMGLP